MKEGAVVRPEELKEAGWQETNHFYAGCSIWKKENKRILYQSPKNKVWRIYTLTSDSS